MPSIAAQPLNLSASGDMGKIVVVLGNLIFRDNQELLDQWLSKHQ